MAIKVLPAEDADMVRIFSISSDAFNVNEPFWDLVYPAHAEPLGRETGGARFREIKNSDPSTIFVKAVDERSGEILGFAKWNIYDNSFPDPPKALGDYWPNDEEKQYAAHMMEVFVTERNSAITKTNGNVVSLDILAVSPAHQRKGVGHKLVEWGTSKADDLGLDAVVESSVYGKGLYQKHGFIFQKDVELEVPDRYAGRTAPRFAWLVRPKKGSVLV